VEYPSTQASPQAVWRFDFCWGLAAVPCTLLPTRSSLPSRIPTLHPTLPASPQKTHSMLARAVRSTSGSFRGLAMAAGGACARRERWRGRLGARWQAWEVGRAGSSSASVPVASPETTRVGFIGIGVMGKSMAGHLLRAGYKVTVYNRTASKVRGAQFLPHLPTPRTHPALPTPPIPQTTPGSARRWWNWARRWRRRPRRWARRRTW
jgi:NAD binding domain of 6-phosphogluconate dehydrogenase